MSMIDSFKEQLDQLKQKDAGNGLAAIRQDAFAAFTRLGIPTVRHEDWKYTRISGLFNKEYQLHACGVAGALMPAELDALRLPDHEQANELVFVNGRFVQELSTIRSAGLKVLPLETAAGNEYKELFDRHFNHSSHYVQDGINALNTALADGGVFVYVSPGAVVAHPVYLYNIIKATQQPVLAQPRSLMYIAGRAEVQLVETYASLGLADSLTNQVLEMVVEEEAQVHYCKIQNDTPQASQVSTTHIRQIGKSFVQAVTISLDGGIVRNNLNAVLEAPFAEAHLYGLYLPQGQTHVSNYTVVDNVVPDCLSNELYKGVLGAASSGVFNGKIFVRKDAQKTNAFQSNKNVLLSDEATINTKPQLEIFADDVKCSHGCTVGRLDEEGLFYLRSRGIPEKRAIALLLQGFAADVLDKIKTPVIRDHVAHLIDGRLQSETL